MNNRYFGNRLKNSKCLFLWLQSTQDMSSAKDVNKNCSGIVHTYEDPGTVHSKSEIRRKRKEEERKRKKWKKAIMVSFEILSGHWRDLKFSQRCS